MTSLDVQQMPKCFNPASTDELVQTIADANHNGQSLEIAGGGTKQPFGGPVVADAVLNMAGLSGIEFYEPEELVIKVRAGTSIATIRETLADKNQHLAFEPPDYAAFFGNDGASDTIGGAIACNLAGPRRILFGSARDAVLGVEGVNGRGEAFKGGGRTVKNVTGYDIPRLMTGSFGVLAALTSITLKVQPAPQSEVTVLLSGLDDAKATGLLSDVLQLPFDISAAAHLAGDRADAPTTALRLEGFPESVVGRQAELESRLRKIADARTITDAESRLFWQRVRDLSVFASDPDACVWRLMLPCTQAARLVTELGGDAVYDWGGCAVFVRTTAASAEQHADALRGKVAEAGGRACLFRAPADLRRRVGAFHPKPETLGDLSERVRQMFDPNGVLNPGKLGIAANGAA